MAEETTTTEAAPETGQSETQEQPKPAEVPPEVKAALKKANKEAETLRLKLKEYEDRDKTEQQKLEERAAAAEKAAAEREAALLRYRVATAKGLPAELVERLRGSTEEELAADADSLLAMLKPQRVTGATDQGSRGGDAPTATINDLLRAARGR